MNAIKNSCFKNFIENISPTNDEDRRIKSSHNNVKKILQESELNNKIFKVILVGSYKIKTNIRTLPEDDKKLDVDLAVIFKHGSFEKPQKVMDKIYNILNNTSEYHGKVIRQKRSIGIELSRTHVDIVPFQCVNNDSDKPLYISSIDKQNWEKTNPICHIEHYLTIKKEKTNFTDFVRALKWYKKINKPGSIRYPSGIAFTEYSSLYYDNSDNLLEALINVMEKISKHTLKYLNDPCTIDNNLLERLNDNDYASFINKINLNITKLKKGLKEKNITLIQEVFGKEFPNCDIFDENDFEKIIEKTKANINYGQ